MSLTGWPLLVLLLALCVALPSAALMGWTRTRSRRLALGSCVALLVIGQFAAVALAAAAVNRSGGYYKSWSQALSTFSPPPSIEHMSMSGGSTSAAGTTPQTAGSLSARTDLSFSTPSQWSTKGRLETISLTGANSGLTSPAYVYLPPQYFQPAYRHFTFPAAQVFTGYPGTNRDLVDVLDYPGVLRSEVAGHRAQPMVLVMLRPSINYPRDTECSNVPAGPQALTYFGQDVPAAMSRHYRVQPTGWGAIGDSTGGYCATKLAMTYPTTFRAAVSLSGYYRALQDHTTGDLWGGSKVVRDLNDLRWRLKNLPAPAVSLLVTISKEEGGSLGYGDTKQFISLAKPPLSLDTIITPHGGHNFQAWSALLPQSLDWLSGKLAVPQVNR